jgi:hypothetical protein
VFALLAKVVRSGTPLAMINAPNTKHGKRKQKESKKPKGLMKQKPTLLMKNKEGECHGEKRLFS